MADVQRIEAPLDFGKLDIHDGDLVVLRVPDDLLEHSMSVAQAFHDMLTGQGLGECKVIVLSPGSSIDTLDDNTMRRLGWVRSGDSNTEAAASM